MKRGGAAGHDNGEFRAAIFRQRFFKFQNLWPLGQPIGFQDCTDSGNIFFIYALPSIRYHLIDFRNFCSTIFLNCSLVNQFLLVWLIKAKSTGNFLPFFNQSLKRILVAKVSLYSGKMTKYLSISTVCLASSAVSKISCSFSPGLIPINIFFAFAAKTSNKSTSFMLGIFGTKISPPFMFFRANKTRAKLSSK